VKILHLVGSPKKEHSMSTAISSAFLDAYLQQNPEDEVTLLDVWAADLPPFDGEMAIAKLAPILGEQLTASQDAAWKSIVQVIEDFEQHDKIVISTPMWNFGLPYKLKHYFDLLVQPGISFGVNAAHEHIGLLRDRPVQLVLTRSSGLPQGSPEDFQLSYLQHILGFIGLRDVKALVVEGTTLPAAADRTALIERESGKARALSRNF